MAAGWAGLPEPIVETAAVAVPLLAERDDPRAAELIGGASAAAVHALSPGSADGGARIMSPPVPVV